MRGNNKHGDARQGVNRAPEYRTWSMIKNRCLNEKTPDYQDYGGRGISIHPRWLSYETFLLDVGRRPTSGMTIDRFPNNDGNYEPGNVRWASAKDQARNRRSSRILTFRGKSATEAEWVEILGINQGTLSSRINRYGWSIERALSTPVKKVPNRG